MRHRLIAVEGPIGVGKTTLARAIARRVAADLVLEAPQANPFLAQFYRDMRRYALQTQLFFLFQRIGQLEPLKQPELFAKPVVMDFMLAKDPLFARLTLDETEFGLYQQIYGHMKPRAPVPDVVICLKASTPTLQKRIHQRGIAMEQTIEADYLDRLAAAYGREFAGYTDSPLLFVDSERFNFADDEAALDTLMEHLAGLEAGRAVMA
jgi:deoxyguanosine kinase